MQIETARDRRVAYAAFFLKNQHFIYLAMRAMQNQVFGDSFSGGLWKTITCAGGFRNLLLFPLSLLLLYYCGVKK